MGKFGSDASVQSQTLTCVITACDKDDDNCAAGGVDVGPTCAAEITVVDETRSVCQDMSVFDYDDVCSFKAFPGNYNKQDARDLCTSHKAALPIFITEERLNDLQNVARAGYAAGTVETGYIWIDTHLSSSGKVVWNDGKDTAITGVSHDSIWDHFTHSIADTTSGCAIAPDWKLHANC